MTAAVEKPIIEASGRFDADFYLRCYAASIPTGQPPLDHFLSVGQAEGLLASPSFDPVVYKLAHPGRRHQRPLMEAIAASDDRRYRDVAPLVEALKVGSIPITYRFDPGLRDEMTAKAAEAAANVGRSVFMPWEGSRYELRNPSPETVISRLEDDRPFSFGRLPHGFWDSLCIVAEVAARLRDDPRCEGLGAREIENLAVRLLAYERLRNGTFGTFAENMLHEIQTDLLDPPCGEDFWTAIALRGAPSFDDGLYGLDPDDMRRRLSVVAQYFGPDDRLYDATMWKRWALSGDLARLSAAIADHPLILVGPAGLAALEKAWRPKRFRHVAIAANLSQVVRYSLLECLRNAICEIDASAGEGRPVVVFQCGGSLAYWFMRRLRGDGSGSFFIDFGQALDIWQWSNAPWMRVYKDALMAANPFIAEGLARGAANLPEAAWSAQAGVDAEVAQILRQDYPDAAPDAPTTAAKGPARSRPGGASETADAFTSVFGEAEIAHFAALLERPATPASPFADIDRKFVVGFGARSGSTLLCQNLFPYGVAAWEFLNPFHIAQETYVKGAKDYGEFCRRLVDTYAVNGAWGVKAHVSNMIPLFFVGEFPRRIGDWRFVSLSRVNVVRQAISLVIAKRRDAWVSFRPSTRDVAEADYSRDEIIEALEQIRRNAALWERFFTAFGIDPLRLTYEEIADRATDAARTVADYCGLVPGGESLVAPFRLPPLERQSAALNDVWEQRFLAEA